MMPRLISFAFLFSAMLLSSSKLVDADILGDKLNAANTFQDEAFTSGAETIFQVDSATVSDNADPEFTLLAGLYEVNVMEDSLTMTLANNTGLAVDQYGVGTFDRYYYGFDGNFVDSASLAGGDSQLTSGLTVGLLPPGFELDVVDAFATGIELPQEFPNGGFFLEFGEGTDLRTLDASVTVNFATTAVPEPSACAMMVGVLIGTVALRRRF